MINTQRDHLSINLIVCQEMKPMVLLSKQTIGQMNSENYLPGQMPQNALSKHVWHGLANAIKQNGILCIQTIL